MKTWQTTMLISAGTILGYLLGYLLFCEGGIRMHEITVAIIGAAGTGLGILVAEIVGWKKVMGRIGDKGEKNLSMKYDDILEQLGVKYAKGENLTVQHESLKQELLNHLQQTLGSIPNSTLVGEIHKVEAAVATQERKMEEEALRRSLLTQKAGQLQDSIDTLSGFSEILQQTNEELVRAQLQVQELTEKIAMLETENQKLLRRASAKNGMEPEIR